MTTGKTIALTRQTFVDKVMSLLFNMLSRLVITLLPRSKCLLISWLQSPSAVILEPKRIKSATVSTVSISVMKWWDRMPWSLFSECWALNQLFHSPLSLSSRDNFSLGGCRQERGNGDPQCNLKGQCGFSKLIPIPKGDTNPQVGCLEQWEVPSCFCSSSHSQLDPCARQHLDPCARQCTAEHSLQSYSKRNLLIVSIVLSKFLWMGEIPPSPFL